MKRLFFYTTSLLSIGLLNSCKDGAFNTSLPANRPAKMVIEMYEGGGMTPESVDYYISEDSCYVKFFKDQSHNTLRFKLSSLALDSLYTEFYENNFDKITAKKSETYDRGGLSVSLHYDDKNFDQVDAGSTYINEAWQMNFYAIVTAIINKTSPVINQNTVPFVIKFDKNILSDSLTFNFQVENFSYNSDSGHAEMAKFSLLKGEHTYFANLMSAKKQGSGYQQNVKANAQGNLHVWGVSDTLFVYLKDNATIVCLQKPG